MGEKNMGRPKKEKPAPLEIEVGKKYTDGNGAIRRVDMIDMFTVYFTVTKTPYKRGRFCEGSDGCVSLMCFQRFAKTAT